MESIASLVAAVLAPVVGLMLRASRRARLRGRIKEYLELADIVEAHDAQAASEFRRLASHSAQLLIERDDAWFGKKFEPVSIVAALLLIAPAVAVIILAWDWDSGWRFLVIGIAGIWAVISTIAGITQLWQDRDSGSDK